MRATRVRHTVLALTVAAYMITYMDRIFTAHPLACVLYTCLAVFGLELTVGVSWAVPLDIASDYAGSVSSVMNMCGNIGGAISPALLAYLVRGYNWEVPFVLSSMLCLMAAALFTRIDAARHILSPGERA